jgi:RNA polymerase sigma factor (sigma-70 family)
LRAWLYAVVRSKATDLIRRKTRHSAQSLTEAIEAGHEPRGDASDPADVYERQWENTLLRTVMDELHGEVSDRSYRVLEMRLLEGRSVAEVAVALKLSSAGVRCRQHRMMRKLRVRLAMYRGEHFGEKRRK